MQTVPPFVGNIPPALAATEVNRGANPAAFEDRGAALVKRRGIFEVVPRVSDVL